MRGEIALGVPDIDCAHKNPISCAFRFDATVSQWPVPALDDREKRMRTAYIIIFVCGPRIKKRVEAFYFCA
jgi:hypothetical protein